MDTQENKLTAGELFQEIKNKKEVITNEKLIKYYDDCLKLIKKFEITGQKKSLKKLKFHITCMEKEMKLIEMGINTYIYFKDIKDYINKSNKNNILLVDIEEYPRDIPDEIVKTIAKTKGIFTDLCILFTDYTGEIKEEAIETKRKEKDPILFGAFISSDSTTKLERFYVLGDWIDEYCDLTLEKLIADGVPTHEIKEKTLEEIKDDINNFKETDEITKTISGKSLTTFYSSNSSASTLLDNKPTNINAYYHNENPKKSFFDKVKSWLSK